MNTWEAIGLWCAIAAYAITSIFVGYDVSRYVRGIPTISMNVWAYEEAWQSGGYRFSEFPWEAIILPLGVSFQAIFLFIHLAAGLIKNKVAIFG